MIRNDKNELIPTRIQSRWRVCIAYRKLNVDIQKDHFSLPLVDQLLERLVVYSYYYFLSGYSGCTQNSIAFEDHEKTIFTYSFSNYTSKRMPTELCNAHTTFQRCMIFIFSDLVEQCMKIFIDDFSVFRSSFDKCSTNLEKVLKRYRKKIWL